jgi:hypothetical protein
MRLSRPETNNRGKPSLNGPSIARRTLEKTRISLDCLVMLILVCDLESRKGLDSTTV